MRQRVASIQDKRSRETAKGREEVWSLRGASNSEQVFVLWKSLQSWCRDSVIVLRVSKVNWTNF